jgi:hypothetical protein
MLIFKKKHYLQREVKTKGVMDLGGASTQFVYVPSGKNLHFNQYNRYAVVIKYRLIGNQVYNPAYKEYFSEIKIYGVVYKPFSHSFLCYGVNELGLLYQSYILSVINSTEYITNSEPIDWNIINFFFRKTDMLTIRLLHVIRLNRVFN